MLVLVTVIHACGCKGGLRPYGKYRLGYIAYGRLLATGTPEEVLHVFSLDTWQVCGPRARLAQLPHEPRGKPGVVHVTAVRQHAARHRRRTVALRRAIEPHMSERELVWKKSQPNLEDMFIHPMQSVADPHEKQAAVLCARVQRKIGQGGKPC